MATRDNEDSEQSQPHGQPSMRRQSAMGCTSDARTASIDWEDCHCMLTDAFRVFGMVHGLQILYIEVSDGSR